MPFHKGWLPREGFCADGVGFYLARTVFNPVLNLPLLLLALYTSRGQSLSNDHSTALKRFKYLVYFSLVRTVNNYLSRRALNNGVTDTYDWNKELVVVTGGSDGIGKQIVLLLAERNIKVAVLDVQPLTYSAPSTVHYVQCDIRSPSAIAQAASSIRSHFDNTTPTVLINNAGVVRGKPLLSLTEADIRLTFDVNALSHYFLLQEFLPAMVSANHGMIVTVSSLASYVATASMTDYASSKAASLALHESLTSELRTRYNSPKIRTVLVTQGYTRTPLFEGWSQSRGALSPFLSPALDPASVAEETVKKVLKGESGQVLLPRANEFFAVWLRVFPYWISLPFRNSLEQNMGPGFKGRMVIEPEKEKGKEKEAKKE